jgi:hypothetical protein
MCRGAAPLRPYYGNDCGLIFHERQVDFDLRLIGTEIDDGWGAIAGGGPATAQVRLDWIMWTGAAALFPYFGKGRPYYGNDCA